MLPTFSDFISLSSVIQCRLRVAAAVSRLTAHRLESSLPRPGALPRMCMSSVFTIVSMTGLRAIGQKCQMTGDDDRGWSVGRVICRCH